MLENPTNRQYVRADNWSVTAKVSKSSEPKQWFSVRVMDVAAGGLLFLTDKLYEKGDELWFDLELDPHAPGIPSRIPMKVKGEIRDDRGVKSGMRAFSVKFTEISDSDRIRLDELVRLTNYKFKMDAEIDTLNV